MHTITSEVEITPATEEDLAADKAQQDLLEGKLAVVIPGAWP